MLKNGLIYEVVKPIVKFFYYMNLVEGFKYLFGKINSDQERHLKGLGIDVFVILKWVAVVVFWIIRAESVLVTIFISYLVWTNIFTYFYYHVWEIKGKMNKDRKRRRFVNLVLAVAFSNLAFAFLYDVSFAESFTVTEGFSGELSFLLYSNYNSLFSDYSYIYPINNIGTCLSLIQLIITFIFATIILNNSIPD